MFDLAITAYYFIQRESDSGGCTVIVANPHATWKEHLQSLGYVKKALLMNARNRINLKQQIFLKRKINAVEDYGSS